MRDVNSWWRCDPWSLPDNAAAKITEMESDCIGIKVRFSCPQFQVLRERWNSSWRNTALKFLRTSPRCSRVRLRTGEESLESGPVEKDDRSAVRSSNGECFFCRVTNVARCRLCSAWIVWARTASGKAIPLQPWPRRRGRRALSFCVLL